jgi:zeaxanthin glucosyltransferase
MRVMLVTSPEKGHLNPMMGVAQWLVRDGHQVGWLCLPEPSPQLAAVDGVEVLHADLPDFGALDLVTGGEPLARLVRDEDALAGWIRMLLLDLVPAQVTPIREAVRAWRPDVIALDGMQYAAVIAAHEEDVPYAGVSSALTLLEPAEVDSALMRHVRALSVDRAKLFARYGMAPAFRTCEALSPWLNATFATRALVGDAADVPPAGVLVGPSVPPASRGDEPDFASAWTRLSTGKPLVYVSYGSQISWQPEAFARIAQAAAPLGVQVLLSCGELADDAAFVRDLAGDVVVVGYAPQRAVLARAAAFVTHGGANSIMEAMVAGVPVLISPVCNDQPVQAHFVARAHVGEVLDVSAASVDDVRAALARLIAPGSAYAARAREVAADYARHDGAREVARRVVAIVDEAARETAAESTP